MSADLRARLAAAVLGGFAVAVACSAGGSNTAESAYDKLVGAVESRDAGLLFDALDMETHWCWMTIQRAHREAYDVVLSNFPEGAERELELKRFVDGATAENPRALFARVLPAATWTTLGAQVGTGGAAGGLRLVGDEQVEITGRGNAKMTFRRHRERRWGWGFAGLVDEGKALEKRALADLEVIRNNAADHERAAARAAR